MTTPSYRSNQKFSIRVVFFAFPIVFVFFALLPTAYLLFYNARVEYEQSTDEILTLEANRINVYLEEIFSTAQHLIQINVDSIETGVLDAHSQEILQNTFLSQVKQIGFISSIYFGNTEGGLANAGYEAEQDEFYVIGTQNFVAGDFVKYAVDTAGASDLVLKTFPDFDARTRDWYQRAVNSKKATWSDVYLLFTDEDMAVAASQPVYDKDGNLIGVVAADLFLGQLSDFLEKNPIYKSGQSLLVDRDGFLIASSSYDVLLPVSGSEEYERLSLDTVAAPEINMLAEYLRTSGNTLSTINEKIKISFEFSGEDYFVLLSPIGNVSGLDWVSVVILPETEFKEVLSQQYYLLIFVFGLLAVLMVAMSMYISHRVLRPLLSLNQKTKNFDLNKPVDLLVHTRLREIYEFSASFDALVQRLNVALSDLRLEVKEHKESKERLLWSETLYRSVVQHSPGLLCTFLPNGEITFANNSYAEYYDSTPNEMVGKFFQSLLHKDDREMVLKEIHALNKERPSSSLVQRVLLPTGEVRRQRWINRALFSESGEVIGYQAFGEDIQKEYQIQQSQSALYRIWRAANQVADLETLYAYIHEIIQEIIPAKNFIITLMDEETHLPNPVYYVDEKDEPLKIQPGQSIPYGPSVYVLEHNTSLRCTPEEFFALMPALDRDEGYGTLPKVWLGTSLILDGRAIGVMAVQDYDDENAFGAYEQEFLEMISPSVAAIIARRRTEEEIAIYAQTNALLFSASQTISQALKLDPLYRTLYTFIIEVMACDLFMVSDYKTDTKMISCEYMVLDGKQHDVSGFPPLPLNPDGEGIQSRVIVNKASWLISDYLEEIKTSKKPHYIDEDGKLHDGVKSKLDESITRSALIVPLFFGGEVSGVIQVMSYQLNAYSQNDLRIVEALSSQIGVALNNASLYQQAQAEIEMRTQAEKALQRFNTQLEKRIYERTKDLNQRIATVEKLNTGMSNVLHDLNIANQQAEATALELREANAELEAFSYSVSHDLRAPLRHIESFTQLLYNNLDGNLGEQEERYFGNIFSATIKMRNLIQDLLSLSRAGRVGFKISQLDMNKIVGNVRDELFNETDERDITWKLASLPPVQADAGLIKIVWTNLIGNAVKYTRLEEKAQIEIGFLTPEDDQQIYFVRDNGIGFEKKYKDKLFGVFQRLHQGDDFEGNGIGLATVRRIIVRHGGKVWAESELGEGSVFYFSLPIRIQFE